MANFPAIGESYRVRAKGCYSSGHHSSRSVTPSLLSLLFVAIGVTAQVLPVAAVCDVTYMGRLGSGTLFSPNFPFDYEPGQTCHYSIDVRGMAPAQEGSSLSVCFTFHRFSLFESTGCEDYISFGAHKFCGTGSAENPDDAAIIGRDNVWKSVFCWPVMGDTFDFDFVSLSNSPDRGFFAYFNVSYAGAFPSSRAVSAPCAASEWTCFNRNCVPLSSLCDEVDDCKDNSDEDFANARCAESIGIEACNFEEPSNPFCEFDTPPLLWRRGLQSVEGPQHDHTLAVTQPGSGSFMYSSYIVGQSVAYLAYSIAIPPVEYARCLGFWYYMSGAVGTLSVQFQTSISGSYVTIWYRTDNQGDKWVRGEVEIPPDYSRIYEVRFKGEKGQEFYSNIGVDDISLTNTKCFAEVVSCTFELNLCNWAGGTLGPFWQRGSGSTQGLESGNTGEYYAYLEPPADRVGAISVGTMYSNHMTPTLQSQHYCISFWYHLGLSDVDALYLEVMDASGNETQSWSSSERMDAQEWKQQFVSLVVNGPFQVIFQGRFTGTLGLIAIDDVILNEGECTILTSGASTGDDTVSLMASCLDGDLLCRTGECIRAHQVCNGEYECTDHSDELNCPGSSGATAGLVIGIIFIILLVIACIVVVVIWYRRSQGKCAEIIPRRWLCFGSDSTMGDNLTEQTDNTSYKNSYDNLGHNASNGNTKQPRSQVPVSQMPAQYSVPQKGSNPQLEASHSQSSIAGMGDLGNSPYVYVNRGATPDVGTGGFSTPQQHRPPVQHFPVNSRKLSASDDEDDDTPYIQKPRVRDVERAQHKAQSHETPI